MMWSSKSLILKIYKQLIQLNNNNNERQITQQIKMLLTSAVSRECGHFPQCFYISQRLSFSPEFCKPSKAREDVGRTVTLEKGKKKGQSNQRVTVSLLYPPSRTSGSCVRYGPQLVRSCSVWPGVIHHFRITDAAATLPSNSGLISFESEWRGSRWWGGCGFRPLAIYSVYLLTLHWGLRLAAPPPPPTAELCLVSSWVQRACSCSSW